MLNRPGAAEAKVLVAGANFGCGSSREHAVWALQDFGFQAVVAPSFGDIFRNNSVAAGLVPAKVSEEGVARLFAALAADPDAEVVVDVAAREVAIPSAGLGEPFELADYAQWRLLEGLDDIGLTLRHEEADYRVRALSPGMAAQPRWPVSGAGAGDRGRGELSRTAPRSRTATVVLCCCPSIFGRRNDAHRSIPRTYHLARARTQGSR